MVDVNDAVPDTAEGRPLHVAAMSLHDNVGMYIHLLCANGALVNAVNARHQTALHCAAGIDNLLAAMALTICGASMDMTDENGDTPIEVALNTNSEACVDFFLSRSQGLGSMSTPAYPPASTLASVSAPSLLTPRVQATSTAGLASASPPPVISPARHTKDASPSLLDLKSTHSSPNVSWTPRSAISENEQAFLRAARSGEFQQLETLLFREYVNINVVDSDGFTAAYLAATNGHARCLDLLLRNRASVVVRTLDGKTALHIAASRGHKDCVQALLLDERTSTRHTDSNGEVALHAAVAGRSNSCILALLNTDPTSIGVRDRLGRTPLHVAVEQKWTAGAQMLLDYEADPNIIDAMGFTVLHRAICQHDGNLVNLIVPKCSLVTINLPAYSDENRTPLQAAIQEHLAECARLLLVVGADPSSCDDAGISPLHAACKLGMSDIVDAMLEAGVDAHVMSYDGKTPAHIALEHGHASIFEKLLNATDVDPSECGADGRTPLISAIILRNPTAVSSLLNKGVDAEVPDEDGVTAEAWAEHMNEQFNDEKSQMIMATIKRACQATNIPIVPGMTELHKAVLKRKSRQIEQLLASGEDAWARDQDGNTALHLAISTGLPLNIVRVLFDPPASPWHIINKRGVSPVDIALGRQPQPTTATAAPSQLARGPIQPAAQIASPHQAVPRDVTEYISTKLRETLRDPENDPTRVWAARRALQNARSAAIDKIMELTGIAQVKRSALKLYNQIQLDLERPPESQVTRNQMLHFQFLGNPGTGKTTVARLFAEMLGELGIRDGGNVIETDGQQLLTEGSDKFIRTTLPKVLGTAAQPAPGQQQPQPPQQPQQPQQQQQQQAQPSKKVGGVLFIDEIYQLDPAGSGEGRSITNALLTATENHRDKFTVIIAGYKEDVDQKFIAFNPGMASRFPIIVTFEDFGATELRRVFLHVVREKGWVVDPRPANIDTANRSATGKSDTSSVAAARLARRAKVKGFANARTVRTFVEQAIDRASDRIERQRAQGKNLTKQELCTLKRDDILGDALRTDSIPELTQLEAMIGIQEVKTSIRQMIEMIQVNRRQEENGDQVLNPPSLHRIFLGKPGTGKTTVATLYGKILGRLGLLSRGDVEIVPASQFVGDAVGVSSTKTNAIMNKMAGKVLVIDEAYVLANSPFGRDALDVLVERIQGGQEDFAVILCGYEEQMKQMLRDCNPGLARRFRIEQAFYFSDFNDADLEKIMLAKAPSQGVHLEPELARAAVKNVLSKQRDKPTFGNAGEVDNLLGQARQRVMDRPDRKQQNGRFVLVESDFFVAVDPRSAASLFDSLSGPDVAAIKETVERMRKKVLVATKQNRPRDELLDHWQFMGPPGTGKTTVARLFGKVYHDLGLLANSNVVEVKSRDLIGQYIGHTAPKVNAKMEEARGGVLFIDEAYGFTTGYNFGIEAVECILANITSPDYKGKIVVIIAGYAEEMGALLGMNPGMPSRFQETLEFHDWTIADCMQHCVQHLTKKHVDLPADTRRELQNAFENIRSLAGWANARDVEALIKKALDTRDLRCDADGNVEGPLLVADVTKSADTMVNSRRFIHSPTTPGTVSAYVSHQSLPSLQQRQIQRTNQHNKQRLVQTVQEARITQLDDDSNSDDQPSNDDDEDASDDDGGQSSLTGGRGQQQKQIRVRVNNGSPNDDDIDPENLLTAFIDAMAAEKITDPYDQQNLITQAGQTGVLPDPIVQHVARACRRPEGKIRSPLILQCQRLLPAVQQKIRLHEEEQRRLQEARDAAERQRIQDEIRERQRVQERLRAIGRCPMNFEWIKVPGGYRCAGGSHALPDAAVEL